MKSLIVKIEDVEIRGHEVKESKKDGKPYMIVRYEDERGVSREIVDRDMENEPYYKRGTRGVIHAELDIGRSFTRFEVARFVMADADKPVTA